LHSPAPADNPGAMEGRFTTEKDPRGWCALLGAAFLALVWWRLAIPSEVYFDETHYVPAARKLIEGLRSNPEHPLLAKQVIAASIKLLGDTPLGWRVPSALAGAWGLYAFGRLVWFASGRRAATLVAMILLATNFVWFVESRIAMLDMIMAALGMTGLWLFASAMRRPEQGRWRLALAGLSLGLALGAKWSIAAVLPLPGLLFLALKLRDAGPRALWARTGGAVPGIGLPEAALWLGLVPLCAYWATFWPGFAWQHHPIDPWAPFAWHHYMLELQDSVTNPHPYRSVWYEWIGNWRAIWFLYEEVDGAQRGILLVGNPFSMLAGLPALGWAVWAGLRRRRRDALAFAVLYAVSLAMWALSGKPIQFYYHYLLPGAFLMTCLALALDELWQLRSRWRWLAPAALALSAGMFAHFYPILSAAELCCGKPSFAYWMWLDSWR
jgi:dolichyl-phosphate-mannose-protein mannosyltransferase